MQRSIQWCQKCCNRLRGELRLIPVRRVSAALQWQAHEIEARTELVVQVEADGVDAVLDRLHPAADDELRFLSDTLDP